MNRQNPLLWFIVVCALCLAGTADAWAQEQAQATGSISGAVLELDTEEPLTGANVLIEGLQRGTSTGADGTYRIENVPVGEYTLRVTFIGYENERRTISVTDREETVVDVVLTPRTFVGDEVVVTGSKRPEKLLDAPVQIEAISADELDVSGGGTYLSALSTVKGVDFVNVGINGQGISARGFNNHFNTRMLQMKDGRVAQLPGTGLPQGNFLPTSELDVKSIEVVVGPASALYGPNAHTGVVNVITKDPWDQSGVALNVRGGQQSLLDINGRTAGTFGDGTFGWKLTGQYMTADDFAPPSGGPNASASDSTHFYTPVFNESELVGDYDIESIRAEGSLYYRFGDDWQANFAYGFSENDNFGLTNNGRNHIRGWQVQYQNLQVSNENWFAQVTHTSNDAGDTYQINGVASSASIIYGQELAGGASPEQARQTALDQLPSLREANKFVDRGELWDSEIQYRNTVGLGSGSLDIVTGAQGRRYLPDSDGTFLADAVGRDLDATEVGGYLQLDYRPTDALRINGAVRVDDHSEYDTQISPKAAIVYSVLPNQNVRVGYNRAFKSPTVLEGNLFIPIPIPAGNGVPPGYVVNALGNYTGFEIRDPNGDVIREISALSPEEVNSIEVGYKGVFGKSVFLDIVAYQSWYNNFISPLQSVANGFTEIPFYADGTPVDAPGSNDNFNGLSTYVNFGEATVRGLDAGINVYFNDHFNVSGNLSLIELADFEEGDSGSNPLLLNVPTTKAKGSATVRDLGFDGWFLSASGRWHAAYEFASGSHWVSSNFYEDGEVPGRFSMGLTAGYTVPETGVQVKASVSNLFDTETPDVLGAPVTGRLFWMSATYTFDGLNL
ncbi:TonB-dependent receptor [Longibacter salinarum]|nr:TonB-dependent receptor [Longibacter salinarum]